MRGGGGNTVLYTFQYIGYLYQFLCEPTGPVCWNIRSSKGHLSGCCGTMHHLHHVCISEYGVQKGSGKGQDNVDSRNLRTYKFQATVWNSLGSSWRNTVKSSQGAACCSSVSWRRFEQISCLLSNTAKFPTIIEVGVTTRSAANLRKHGTNYSHPG